MINDDSLMIMNKRPTATAKELTSVELFTGAGGLAMGIAKAGFRHLAVVEWDHDSCETIRYNQLNSFDLVKEWPIFEVDARKFDYRKIKEPVDLVAGGPPCQPFSLAGKHRGFLDPRDMWPEAVRAVRELRPRAFIFENVKGLLRPNFSEYFNYIILQLTYPDASRYGGETWPKHLERLRKFADESQYAGPRYNVDFKLLHAADYGVPQKRERVVIVGFRSDINRPWSFPVPTHSEESLVRHQWITGEYWARHAMSAKTKRSDENRRLTAGPSTIIQDVPRLSPWLTVRDAIAGLPQISSKKVVGGFPNHVFQPGAKFYPGHTGSFLDEPAKTLKAGGHGVPGGENMLVTRTNYCRYFSVREAARIQCFPDEFVFPVSWTESMRQLGNAVPVRLAFVVAENVKKTLLGAATKNSSFDQEKYARKRELQSA